MTILFCSWFLWDRTSLVAQIVKRLPTMQETRVQSLGWEDLLEKEMATYSSTLAWKIPWTEEPGSLQSVGLQRFGHDWATSLYFFYGTKIWLKHRWVGLSCSTTFGASPGKIQMTADWNYLGLFIHMLGPWTGMIWRLRLAGIVD